MSEPSTSQQTPPAPKRSLLRRIAGAALIGLIVYAVLWYAVFNAVTSAIVASGGAVVLLAGASASETFQSLFDAVAEFVLGVFGAIADVFASLFDWS